MVEAQSISEQTHHSSKHQAENHLSLASLHDEHESKHHCHPHGTFRQQDAPIGSSDNNYVYFGDTPSKTQPANPSDASAKAPTDTANPPKTTDSTSRAQPTDNSNQGGTKVTLKSGDTFWGLSAQYYPGQTPPIEAIYEANGLMPQIKTDANGNQQLVEPTYYAGKTYVMPPASEIQQLTQEYRNQVQQLKDNPSRVGGPNQETKIQLIYGDTLSDLSQAKYGDANAPLAAIYEANGITPKLEQGSDGQLKLVPPTYYSGQTFTFPAESDIPKLEQEFYTKIGHPELIPQQYANAINGSGAPTDSAPNGNGGGSTGQTTAGGWELPTNAGGSSTSANPQAGSDSAASGTANGGSTSTSGGWDLPGNASGGSTKGGATAGDTTQSSTQTHTTAGGWVLPGSTSASPQGDITAGQASNATTAGGWNIPSGANSNGSDTSSSSSSSTDTSGVNSDGSSVATIGDALNSNY